MFLLGTFLSQKYSLNLSAKKLRLKMQKKKKTIAMFLLGTKACFQIKILQDISLLRVKQVQSTSV